MLKQEGVLDLAGDVAWRGTYNIARPANAQEWALNPTLVNVEAWLAFYKLGGNATANFEIRGGGVHVPFGEEVYIAVGVSPFARTSNGSRDVLVEVYSVPEDVFDRWSDLAVNSRVAPPRAARRFRVTSARSSARTASFPTA